MIDFQETLTEIFEDHMFSKEEMRTMEIVFWAASLNAIDKWQDAKGAMAKVAIINQINEKAKLALDNFEEMMKEKAGE